MAVFSSDAPHPSMRKPEAQGSYLLQEFKKTLDMHGDDFELMQLILVVIHNVAEEIMNCKDSRSNKRVLAKQNPCFKSYMRKFFFFPSTNADHLEEEPGKVENKKAKKKNFLNRYKGWRSKKN